MYAKYLESQANKKKMIIINSKRENYTKGKVIILYYMTLLGIKVRQSK